ncbi:hypothetical protein [Leisingera sp. ANG-Vp]|uniref:hypothetical protein n=1 Tax=Leisingera sp. ANG-Vp TaxID=1577896 RepID=UPI00057CC372|nr:hypothetical protein [Leisingera sp. ANG-Vp]KIC18862.1 hypothetical protein RA20_12795 [Leisingera sp. ANG-Vp]
MLAAILLATAGVAIAAAVIDSSEDEGASDGTPPIEEDGLTVVAEDGEPEQIDLETLEEVDGAQVFEGSEENETIYIDPDTTSEFSIQLNSGGADTVVTGLGQFIDTRDDEEADAEENADTVRLVYTPDAAEELFENGSVRSLYYMDSNDVLELEFPEGSDGTVLPVHITQEFQPGPACCSSGENIWMTLVYVPAGVEYSEEELEASYGHNWEEFGMVPIADFYLGERGDIDRTHEGGERIEWDDVTAPPILTSNLPIAPRIFVDFF